jgi:hypothetical protein
MTGLLTVVELESLTNGFDPTTLSGSLSYAIDAPSSGLPTVEFDLTGGGCGTWDGNGDHIRFGVVDVTGSFSGWSGWYATK